MSYRNWSDDSYDDPYICLANAVILRACQDYVQRKVNNYPMPYVIEVTRFFRSEWFQMLTTIDGEYILHRLDIIVDEHKIKRRKSFLPSTNYAGRKKE